jgi:hypothetical protein
MSVHDLRRAIEPLKARAREAANRRGPVQPDPELLARLDSALAAARSIEATLRELSLEINGLFPYRRLGHGGWVVGIAGIRLRPRPGRRPRVSFTHFEVVVTTSEDGHALQLDCHRSVCDHDLDLLRHSQPIDAPEFVLEEWIESACLEFAEAVFAARDDETWKPRRAVKTV